jgi:hypothetical protein
MALRRDAPSARTGTSSEEGYTVMTWSRDAIWILIHAIVLMLLALAWLYVPA